MEQETIKKIIRIKKILENKLKVKISRDGNEINLEGDEVDVYIAEKVLLALERNFPLSESLLLLEENYMLEDIPIKNLTRKKLSLVKARIIGTRGKTLKLISELSDCYLELNNNIVSIIGHVDKIKYCINAIENLIHGMKQSTVYTYLEKARVKTRNL